MNSYLGFFAVGWILLAALSAQAEVIKGVLSVTGGEMPWWGGLVRDTIARQSDVDKNSLKYEVEPGSEKYRNGTITFYAQKGKSIDLEKILHNIKDTRLSGTTRSAVNYLEITVQGTVSEVGKGLVLQVAGASQQFGLEDDPTAKPKQGTESLLQRLRVILAKGEKNVRVTGRLKGWHGPWPVVLRELTEKPTKDTIEAKPPIPKPKLPLLIVTDFQTTKE